jgi:hypothetical protein
LVALAIGIVVVGVVDSTVLDELMVEVDVVVGYFGTVPPVVDPPAGRIVVVVGADVTTTLAEAELNTVFVPMAIATTL